MYQIKTTHFIPATHIQSTMQGAFRFFHTSNARLLSYLSPAPSSLSLLLYYPSRFLTRSLHLTHIIYMLPSSSPKYLYTYIAFKYSITIMMRSVEHNVCKSIT